MLSAGARGEDDHRQVARGRLTIEAADQLVAVEARHLQIGDDDVDRLLGQLLERLGAVPRGDDVEARALEHAADEFPHADRVVDEQNATPWPRTAGAATAARSRRISAVRGQGRGGAHLEELQRVEQQDDAPLSGDGRAREGSDALRGMRRGS